MPIPSPGGAGTAWACEWLCDGEEGELELRLRLGMLGMLLPATEETSESVGSRSRLVFVDPPSARYSASRSAGDGANARIEMDEKRFPPPVGSCSGSMLGMLSDEGTRGS